jgi:hypothetical protein
MGQFDDNKYVQDLEREFLANEDTLGKSADALLDQLKAAQDLDTLTGHRPEVERLIGEFKTAKRDGEAAMLASTYKARRAALAPKPIEDAVEESEDRNTPKPTLG